MSGRRIDFKVAIIKSGKNQRQLAEVARIPEVKLSKIVTGHASPSTTERVALAAALGQDFFATETGGRR